MNAHETAYREWCRKNPRALDLFLRFAREALRAGRPFGVKALAERVRWETSVRWGRDRSGFKWNNNYTAYLARDLVRAEPQLAGLIELRRVREEAA